ncbi:MAG TPA: SitI3 family protein [Acidimicrobiales bacterium]|jgi:hypothetical protein|nr:SitI3 family protein [Acidimicrobiales bacterium]
MATMYHLELTDEATPLGRLAETVRATSTRLGLLARVAEAPEPAAADVILTSGLTVDVDRPFVTGEDPLVAAFGMARAATVDFTFDSREDPDRQFDELLRLVFGLLEAVPGDAVLHYEYAEVWLVRRGGLLVLNDDDVMWPPEELPRIDAPYQRSHLAFVTT